MKLKEETIKEINQLPPQQVSKVYDFIQAIKQQHVQPAGNKRPPYLRAREILKRCRGSLADDIRMEREDRI